MIQREQRTAPRLRRKVLGLCLGLAACAGGPRAADELAGLSIEELVAEAVSPAANAEFYVRYDKDYRPLLVKELAARLQWTAEEQEQVLAGKGWVGATPEQITVAWGQPAKVAKGGGAAEAGEQWFFGDPESGQTIVTFVGGRCTGWTQQPAPVER